MITKENIKNNETLSGPVLLIMTGFICNNDCIMCSVKPKGLHYKPRETEEIIVDMEKGRELQYERIEFTGGEPTMRTDLLLLIGKAKQLGYKEIALGTNARTLSSLNFLKSLQKAGLNRITTTLYGYGSKSHEAVTRVPGSFKLTVQGIKNSLSLGITITVNTVVFSLTAKNLPKTGRFLASLGVQYWTLLDLIPDGYAFENYHSLSLSPQELIAAFKKIGPVLSKFKTVNLMDFSYCLFPLELLKIPNCNFVNAKGRTEIINQVGYQPKRFEKKSQVFYDIHKTRNNKCQLCAYNNDCGGIWIPYLDLYGDSFIKPFPKKNSQTSPYLYVGYYCNNNCLFCSEADEYLEQLKKKTLDEIKNELTVIRKNYEFVNIMGREPTIRPDILEIINFAQSLKFRQVGITTNGRLLSIPAFAKAILASGVNQVGISLSGATAATHDHQTQVPGSFLQTIAGIKNVLKYKKPEVSLLVNLPMDRLNYQELKAELKLLTDLGVREINILNISPLSRRSRTKKIIVPMAKLGAYVFKTLKDNSYLNRKNLKILLVEFPPCSLPEEGRKYFFPCLEKNNNKVRIPLCRSCPSVSNCDGILDSYLELYGSSEFRLD